MIKNWHHKGWINSMQQMLRKAHHWCKPQAGDFTIQKHNLYILMEKAQTQKDFASLKNLHDQLDDVLQRVEIL